MPRPADHRISVSSQDSWRLTFHCVHPWEPVLLVCWRGLFSQDMLSRTLGLALGQAGPQQARGKEAHLAQW